PTETERACPASGVAERAGVLAAASERAGRTGGVGRNGKAAGTCGAEGTRPTGKATRAEAAGAANAIVVVDDAGTNVARVACVVCPVADIVVIAASADVDVETGHPGERGVRRIAPQPAVQHHAGVPTHRHIVRPGRRQTDIHGARVGVVLRDRIPAGV